jgi:hypothetical protein
VSSIASCKYNAPGHLLKLFFLPFLWFPVPLPLSELLVQAQLKIKSKSAECIVN